MIGFYFSILFNNLILVLHYLFMIRFHVTEQQD